MVLIRKILVPSVLIIVALTIVFIFSRLNRPEVEVIKPAESRKRELKDN